MSLVGIEYHSGPNSPFRPHTLYNVKWAPELLPDDRSQLKYIQNKWFRLIRVLYLSRPSGTFGNRILPDAKKDFKRFVFFFYSMAFY